MNARTSWSARMGRRSSQGKRTETVKNGDLPLDDLLDARFDDEGRLAQIGRGNRQRVAERLDPRPPALNAEELERAVQKLARGLEAIERQGAMRRTQASTAPSDRSGAGSDEQPAGREVVTHGLDRLEARLEALGERLQQRLSAVESAHEAAPQQLASDTPERPPAQQSARPLPRDAAAAIAEPSLALDLRREGAPDRGAPSEPEVTWARLDGIRQTAPVTAVSLPRAEFPGAPTGLEPEARRQAESPTRPQADLKQQFAALVTRIGTLQQSFDETQIQPVRRELAGLLRRVEGLSRDGGSIAGAMEQVRAKLDDVETKVSATRNMTGNRLGDLQDRLAGLSERLGEMESEVPGFDALRENQIALLERFDRMESLVERIASPEELRDRFEELRGQVESVGSQREMARVEDHILRLADRLDQLPDQLGERPVLERMEGQLQALALEFAEARRQRNSGAGELNERLSEIGETLHHIGQANHAPDLSGLEQRLAEISGRLEDGRQSSGEVLGRLETRLAALSATVEKQEAEGSAEILSGLTRKMDALAGAIEDQDAYGARRDVEGLGKKLDQLHGAIADQAEHLSRAQTRFLEERLDEMQQHVQALAGRAQDSTAQFGPFAQKLQEISDRLNGLGAADGESPLSARLTAIEDRLAGMARKGGEPRALHTQLDNIVSRLEVLKGGAIDANHLNTLFERVDAAVRAGAADARFDRLEQKLAETAVGGDELARIEQKLESGLQESFAAERFARLEEKLEDLGRAYSSAAGGEGLSPGDLANLSGDIVALRRELRSLPGLGDGEGNLGSVLKTISERLERSQEQAPTGGGADIEAQIERVARLLEDPSHNRLALAHIENSLKSIEEQLEETRRTVLSRAASDEDDSFEPQDIQTVANLARGLSDDVNVLKNSAEASDRRTNDALDAVQSTLEAVVKRMAFLERDAEGFGAAGDGVPAVLRSASDPQPVPGLAAEPDPAREPAGGGLFSRLTSSQLLRRATGGRAESFSPDSEESDEAGDLPLEPGTDSPLNSALTGAPSSDTVRMSGGRGSDSVGLNAALKDADGRSRRVAPEPVTNEDFLRAARRAAQAAAAEAAGPQRARDGESGPRRLVGRIAARRRAVLAGVLTVAVAFAALQFVRTQIGAEPIDLASSSGEVGAEQLKSPAPVAAPAAAPKPQATEEARTPPPQPPESAAVQTQTVSTPPSPPGPAETDVVAVSVDAGQELPGRAVRTVVVRAPSPAGAAPGPSSGAGPVTSAASEPAPPPILDAAASDPASPEVRMAAEPVAASEPETAEAKPASPPEVTASLSPAVAAPEVPASPAAPNAPPAGFPEAIGPDRLREAALGGDPAAAFEVGARYAEGRGALQDMASAVAWYERAAGAGLAPAQYRLGSIYEKGLGVEKDLARAQDWYLQAAEAGNVKAMHNLAVLYAEGAGGEPNLERAGDLFQKAAEHGVRDSQFNLAILHARGLGVPQDLVNAYKWFAVAASSGDEESVKRRDIIAAAMNEGDLVKAKAAAEAYKPAPLVPEANEIAMPEGGWGEDTSLQHLYSATDTVALVQKLLAEKGYDPGPADGMLGAKTVQAITAFQEEAGLPASGQIDPPLVAKLQERPT